MVGMQRCLRRHLGPSRITSIIAPASESFTSVKHTWRTPASSIGNLVSIPESASSDSSSRRALEYVFPRGTWHDRAA